jgi:hypothetical protein
MQLNWMEHVIFQCVMVILIDETETWSSQIWLLQPS